MQSHLSVILCHVDTVDHPMGHVQRTNLMRICCMYNRPILWGHDACYKVPDACTEAQSYGTVHVPIHVPMPGLK